MNRGDLDRARNLLAEVLGIDPAQVEDTAGMTTLAAWDSLAHVRIILRLEREVGRTLEPDQVLSIGDLGGVAQVLAQG